MLVCTTIVESGLDIPAANTIFVNRADRFGLSQIYQLRGRVGRAGEQAYAYLFIPKDSNIGEKAQKRLKVLMEHSDLGSGFKIAMSDLQIRGGGAVLGASQSGHIAAVGYDMFLKLMEDTINELKGNPVQYDLEPEINIPLSAYISQEYITDIDQRLSAYRRLVKMEDLIEISLFKEELIDRYGKLPDETGNLLLKIMLKVFSKKAGVVKLDFLEKYLKLQFSDVHQKNPLGVIKVIESDPINLKFTEDNVFIANLPKKNVKQNFIFVKKILKNIAINTNG
jgi:transcription-repair coupling factor (superfamily II helicase)